MRRMRHQAFRGLLAYLRACYEPRDLDGFPQHVLAGMPSLVPSDWVWYNNAKPLDHRIDWVIDPLDTFPGAERVFAECMHEHPCLLYFSRVPNGRSWRLSDFLPSPQFHRTRIYNEFYRRRGIEYQLGIRLSASPSRVIAVGVNRAPRQRDFSDEDMLCLDLLGPHLVEAYRNAEALTEFTTELTRARRVEDLDRGVVALRGRRVEWVSPRARRLLGRYIGWPSRRSAVLPDILLDWMFQQQSASVSRPRRVLLIERGDNCLRVRLLAAGDTTMLLVDERARGICSDDLAALGLTGRETEVLVWVARGKTNQDTAMILGTRPATVAKHLERIFRKLGVETRTAAAALAFEVAAKSIGG